MSAKTPSSNVFLQTVVFAFFGWFLSFITLSTSAMERPTLTIQSGTLAGINKQGVEQFLGLPFAQAPTGKLRWMPPQTEHAWEGVRDASQFGSSCPQNGGSPPVSANTSEDCLVLNLYRPINTQADANLPVMLFAYGGGNVSSGAVVQNGARMSQKNNAIIVIPNYRLGALGFLNPAEFTTAKTAGNYGVLDIKAALQWVQKNIAHFGGDPKKVTLASQSSGATNTCQLLVDSAAAGLFSAVILSSDDCIHDVDTVASSKQNAREFAAAQACLEDPDILTCLQNKSISQILAGSGRWNPNNDISAFAKITSGEWNKVPVMLGSTRNEGRGAGLAYTHFSQHDYQQWLQRLVAPPYRKAVLKVYPHNTFSGNFAIPYLMGQFITDSGMRGLGGCINLRLASALAKQVPTYYYQFEDDNPPTWTEIEGYQFLASHGMDMQYLWSAPEEFNTTSAKFTKGQQQLSDQMIHYWGAFSHLRQPKVDSQPSWPALTSPEGRMMAFRPGDQSQLISTETFNQQHHCQLWNQLPIILNRGE